MPKGARAQLRFNPFASAEPETQTESTVESDDTPIAAQIASNPPFTEPVQEQENTVTATAEAPAETANEIFDFSFTPNTPRGRKPNPNRYMSVVRDMTLGQQKGVVVKDDEDADKQRILLRRAGKDNQCSVITTLVQHEGKLILGFQKVERIERNRLSDEEKAARKAAKEAKNAQTPAPAPTEDAASLAANGFAS